MAADLPAGLAVFAVTGFFALAFFRHEILAQPSFSLASISVLWPQPA
jgi:hypothetical protein